MKKDGAAIIKESADGKVWSVLETETSDKTYLKAGPEYCITVIKGTAYLSDDLDTPIFEAKAGDSMWKIAVKFEVGLSEIKSAKAHITNPDLIYPGQILNIKKPDATVTKYENEVVRLVNEIRVKNGLNPLEANWELSRVARYKSQDMKDNHYFSHTSPIYGTPFTMIKNFGISYKIAAENIAKGQATPQAVVNAWMNSSGHRANILNASYQKIGVGYVANGNYWTQMFIG